MIEELQTIAKLQIDLLYGGALLKASKHQSHLMCMTRGQTTLLTAAAYLTSLIRSCFFVMI